MVLVSHKTLESACPSPVTDERDEFAFHYQPNNYPANWLFQGSYKFSKHFYPCPGEMRPSGEEYECAQRLDAAPEVKFWVRNLAKQESASFWLQTATDRFYPDFVALLTDGRVLAVEYKGDAYASNDDSKEKRALGELWKKRSDGRCLFLMAERVVNGWDIGAQIARKIAANG